MNLPSKLFLRITLSLVGCAAVTGVLAVLGAAGSHGGQVGGTCAVAFAVVFSAWCARDKFSQPHARPAELMFAGGLAISLLLAVAAIWLPDSLSHATGQWIGPAAKLGWSSACFYLAALVGSSVFAIWKIPAFRFASLAGTLVVGLLLALALAGIWGASERCLQAISIVAPFGLAIAVSLIGLGHERRPWRWIGFGAAWIMMAWGLAKITSPIGFWNKLWSDHPWYIAGCCVVAGATYALVMARPPLRTGQEWLRKLAFALTGLLLLAVCALAFHGRESEFLQRSIAAGAILAVCGTLAVLILSRFAQQPAAPAAKAITHLTLTCPRCEEKQAAPLGTSPCVRCRALLTVGYAEAHCGRCQAPVCDAPGDACPHCGAPLPAKGAALPPAAC